MPGLTPLRYSKCFSGLWLLIPRLSGIRMAFCRLGPSDPPGKLQGLVVAGGTYLAVFTSLRNFDISAS